MNILLRSRTAVEDFLKQKSMMTPNLIGMNFEGEKAYVIPSIGMNEGYEITIGIFGDLVRYVAFKKHSPQSWSESDMRVTLMQIGPFHNWTIKTGSDFFDYSETDASNAVTEATGWQSPKKRYSFLYVPVLPGAVAIAPDKSAIDAKLS